MACVLASTLAVRAAGASTGRLALAMEEKGVHLDVGAMGSFTLEFPVLVGTGDKHLKPIEKRVDHGIVHLRYDNGAAIAVGVAGSTIELSLKDVPDDVKSFLLSLYIPIQFNNGGHWRIGGKEADFPQTKPSKPHLFQGNAREFELSSLENRRLFITVPEYSYQQLQDNREWGWNIFLWTARVPYNRAHKKESVTVSLEASSEHNVVLVDRFGQTTRREFPGRIRGEADLKADVMADNEYYGTFPAWPSRDPFGGLAGSGTRLGLSPTGFFHVEKKRVKDRELWIMVDPAGNAFFHLGLCSFCQSEDYTLVEGRTDSYEWIPPHTGEFAEAWHPEAHWKTRAVSFYKANVIRKFGAPFDDLANQRRMVDRVRRVGFNSVGAFSPASPAFAEMGMPRVAMLPLGYQLGGEIPGLRGVFDPFDTAVLTRLDTLFAKTVAAAADDPMLIGYFLANEQGFEDLPRAVPALNGKHACKRRLIEMLKAKYPDIAALNMAWGLQAASFEALADTGLPITTRAACEDMQAYSALFLETYFRIVSDTFHKYDRHHLLLGNRWQPGTANNETLCRMAGRYMDVISINYYTCGIDAAFMRRLYDWTGGKPQMWSEFYFTAEKESNVTGRGQDLPTQRERGLAYRYYVETAASLGFVVGIEWFTLIDQAVTGRFFEKFNGERHNTGLFNVADRPYKPMLEGAVAAHADLYDVWLDGKAPYLFDEPRFAARAAQATRTVTAGHATGPMAIDGQLDGWPGRPPERIGGDRLVNGRGSAGLEAAFKVSWDEENLYLLVPVTDATPMKNSRKGGQLWSADGVELFVGSEKLDQGGPLMFGDRHILIGGGENGQVFVLNTARQPAIPTAVVPAVDGKGYTIEAAIPWSALDVTPKAGMQLLFDLAVDNSDDGQSRTCQVMWNGGARNSSDRSGWGRLTLVP